MDEKYRCEFAYVANMWSIWNMRKLMSGQVILALKSCIANIANKASFDSMRDDMLFDETAVRVSHLTFRTTIQCWAIKCFCFADFARLRSWFLLLWCFLLLLFPIGNRSHCGCCDTINHFSCMICTATVSCWRSVRWSRNTICSIQAVMVCLMMWLHCIHLI